MHRTVRPLSTAGLLLLVSAVTAAGQNELSARPSVRPAVLPFLGAGGFPQPRDVETGQTDRGRFVLGAALDLPIGRDLVLAPAFLVGVVPFACYGGCANPGTSAEVALLWLAASAGPWGALLGPSASFTNFDGARGGLGVAASVGVVNGVGPRVSVRYHVFTGARRSTSLMAVFALRLGQ